MQRLDSKGTCNKTRVGKQVTSPTWLNNPSELRKRIVAILIFAPLFLVFGSYLLFFGILNNLPFSQNPEQWGQFGDFIGGTLNPFYALLAFLGVLITIYLQSEQLKEARRLASMEEMQRLISSISIEIDSLLKQAPKVVPDEFSGKPNPFTIFTLISALGTSALENDEQFELKKRKTLHCIVLESNAIIIEIQQLVWALDEYLEAGGNAVIIEFYKRRYEVVVSWLNVLGFESERVTNFFKPQDVVIRLKKTF